MSSKLFLVSSAALLAASLSLPGLAVAQSLTTKTKTAPSAGQAAQKQPGNAWAVNCGGGQSGGELVCQMVQNVIVQDNKRKQRQRLISVIIRPAKEAVNHQMVIAAPHGLNLIEGVELKVDDAEKITKFPFKTSDRNGTYASEPISDILLEAMRRGRKLNVSYTFANGKKINIPLGLLGFTAAYNKLASN
ncbi:MAG: invasion associated locus B family protein [Pseudomonadota bacterium]